MAKKTKKKQVKAAKRSVAKKPKTSNAAKVSRVNRYKGDLLHTGGTEAKYDRLFEEKLAAQYKEFRNLKDHKIQTKTFMRIIIIIITIILLALLLLSYNM